MEGYKGKMLDRQTIDGKVKPNIGRRALVTGLGAAAVLFASGKFGKVVEYFNEAGEEISFLKVKEDFYIHNKGNPIKINRGVVYVRFRDTTFRLEPVEAQANDGVSALIYRANKMGVEGGIKGDLAERASDLFYTLESNPGMVKNLPYNSITTHKIGNGIRSPIIYPRYYMVPVRTSYPSLEYVPKSVS